MRFLVLVFAAVSTAASAQPAPAESRRPAPTSRVLGADAAEQIPDEEKVKRAKETLDLMRKVLRDVTRRVDQARDTKDVVKLNCVNEKLAQIQGLVRISEEADAVMKDAISRKDASTAAHEFTKLSIAREKIDQLRSETEECIGQLAFRTDENMLVEMKEPEGLPRDPTRVPALAPVPSRPQAASTTQ